jgi:F-type H+-transporting ATPase subunit a
MSLAGLVLGALLALPAQHGEPQPHAALPATEHGGTGVAQGQHAAPAASEIFTGLFKHLEPHAVFGVWLGGAPGLAFLPPHPPVAEGQEPPLDAHGHPIALHSSAELQAAYAERFGGGRGVLVTNTNTVQWLAGLLLVVLAVGAARSARRQAGDVPRGRAFHLLESIVLFVRDDMVHTVMGKEVGRPFVPFFLTQFFFILFLNLFGLIPLALLGLGSLGATATANVMVTAGMALTTLVVIHASGIRQHGFVHHWKNFVPHGLPWFVLPIMIPVEIIGMLVKPVALTIRLAANMTAGHLVMLSFFGLVYLFGAVGLPALAMAIAIACLELFVCFVQAYIFTYLSIVFVGASVHPEH